MESGYYKGNYAAEKHAFGRGEKRPAQDPNLVSGSSGCVEMFSMLISTRMNMQVLKFLHLQVTLIIFWF